MPFSLDQIPPERFKLLENTFNFFRGINIDPVLLSCHVTIYQSRVYTDQGHARLRHVALFKQSTLALNKRGTKISALK